MSGGDAIAEAHGRTTGDGQAITVGGRRLPNASLYYGAFGGWGGAVRIGTGPLALGDGGDAASLSTGIAEGDSLVTVIDSATGGAGGRYTGGGTPVGSVGGDGGDATSWATATGAGTTTFGALAVAYREEHIELHRRELGDLSRGGTLSMDEVRRHLAQSVLPRLAGDGILAPLPDVIDDDCPVRLAPDVLEEIGERGAMARDALLTLAVHSLRRSGPVAVPSWRQGMSPHTRLRSVCR